MTRLLGLVSLLVSLAVVGYLYTAQADEAGLDTARGSAAAAQAEGAAAAATLVGAATALQAAAAVAGTYAGADVSQVPGVRLARADATSFCLESGGLHLAGPGGAPAPGPCEIGGR